MCFAFAFVREGRAIDNAAAGILWVTVAFAGTLALGRTFERERQGETLRALLLSPVERPAIYLGKLAALLVLLFGVRARGCAGRRPACFRRPSCARPGCSAGILASGMIGFASVGTLFAAMLVRAQSRDVLLPVVLYPMTMPALLGGMQGTAAIFASEPNLELALDVAVDAGVLRRGVHHAGALDVCARHE